MPVGSEPTRSDPVRPTLQCPEGGRTPRVGTAIGTETEEHRSPRFRSRSRFGNTRRGRGDDGFRTAASLATEPRPTAATAGSSTRAATTATAPLSTSVLQTGRRRHRWMDAPIVRRTACGRPATAGRHVESGRGDASRRSDTDRPRSTRTTGRGRLAREAVAGVTGVVTGSNRHPKVLIFLMGGDNVRHERR